MLEGFLLNTFDRGLSTVDVDDPETREGVRVLPATSSLGRRETCSEVLGRVTVWGTRGLRTVGALSCRPLTASEGLGTGTRGLVTPLAGCT